MSARYDRPGQNGAGYFGGDDNRFRSEGKIDLTGGSVTLAASDNGDEVNLGDVAVLRLLLDVTAHTGGGDTLDVDIETSKDASTWRSLGSFTQSVAVGLERMSFSGCDRFVRYAATLAGAGVSITFEISGETA